MKRIIPSRPDWFLSCLRSKDEIHSFGSITIHQGGRLNEMLHKSFRALLFTLLIILVFGLFAGPAVFAQEPDWQPQRTWVFIVGTLKWKHSDVFSSFPQKNRRDAQLVDFFQQQGVPADQLVYLQDAQATTRQVKSSFSAFLSQAREGDLLFLYYCGHGYKSDDGRTTYFATYDATDDVPGWSTDSIVRDIEKYFKGSRAFLAADSCYSGSLAEQARKMRRQISYASLTSASASELSTENWTFTEMLLAGLRGKAFADINGDGRVTLGELAQDVSADMVFAEEQQSEFVATGKFPPGTVMAVAPQKSNPEISRRVEVKSEGAWYKARIIDARAGRFRVHYFGWEDSDDEWILPNQIRKMSRLEYGVGAMVEVNWKGQWYSAQVLKLDRGEHLIHYVGYDGSWDEWVSSKRIRRP